MDLILWRHAEAVETPAAGDDLARPLTLKGERQAHRVGHWLNRVLPSTTRILVSPAVRAQQTAEALDRRFRTCAALAPDAGLDALLEAARWPHSREPVLVVGHQPTLGLAAAHLIAGLSPDTTQAWRIKKGGVWWLRRRPDEEGGGETLVAAVRSPDIL